METTDLPVSHIYPHCEARPLDSQKVEALAESIREVGLLNPIIVRKAMKVRNGAKAEAWEIIAGHHRYEACAVHLKWERVPCVVRDTTDLLAELMMIDENLCRAELTQAQAAYQTARRKDIYEALHPDAKHGAAGANARWNAGENSAPAFSDATAQATGRSKRTVQIDAARGAALGEDLKRIANTSLDKGVEIDALIKLDPEQREEAIMRAERKEKVSAREIVSAPALKLDQGVKGDAARSMARWLAERSTPDQWDWIRGTLYTAGAKIVADAFGNEIGAGVATMDRANERWG